MISTENIRRPLMPKDSYKVNAINLKTADNFEVLVLTLPENELNDKLAHLTQERGNITKSLYEDFLLTNCVANINQLIGQVKQNFSGTTNLLDIRAELIDNILELNPKLDPNNLVINKNFVVKIMTTKKPKSNEKLLVEGANWSKSYYEDAENIRKTLENDNGSDFKKDKASLKRTAATKLKDINELEFEEKQVWWDTLGQYIKIKKYKEEDVESILKKRYFTNKTSFNTFIVSVCVVDFEDLFLLIDNMKITSKIPPPKIINELCDLCVSENKFLTFDSVRDLAEDSDINTDPENFASPFRASTSGSMGKTAVNKKKKKFKDVPKEDLLNLANNMKISLVGQDEAVDTLTDAIQRASVGLKDPIRPIGSFLFAGRTGVGKSLATKVLADELIKTRDNLITIDCSEYSSDHEYAKLIGSPAGYIGFEHGGVLTNAMMRNPFAVVVFDEVEKASTKIHELMLQILEEGRLTDGKGQKVSFKDAIIIMTSNVGAKEIEQISKTIGFGSVNKITETKKDIALKEALKNKFKPEFLNRLDAVVNFRTLSKKDYMRIIDIELFKLNDNLRTNETEYKNLSLEFDKSVCKHILKKGIDEHFGARPLKRCIEKEISTPLARKILAESLTSNASIKVNCSKGKITFKVVKDLENDLLEGGKLSNVDAV
jgi:ATP-dependent Clp protease ATP-binding subunit ClpC